MGGKLTEPANRTPYDIAEAKRMAKKGDVHHLTELAELAEYHRGQQRTWFLIAKGMGYETAGEWRDSPELSEFVQGQLAKSREKIQARITEAALSPPGSDQ